MTLQVLTCVSDGTQLSCTVPSWPEPLPSSNHRSQLLDPSSSRLPLGLRMGELGSPYGLEKYSPPANVLPLQLC